MLWKCICGKSATVASWKTDKYISPRSERFCYLLLLQKQIFRPHSFSQQHQTWSELCQTSQHQLVITKWLMWRNWTLQSDWRGLYRPRWTNCCIAVLPDDKCTKAAILWFCFVAHAVEQLGNNLPLFCYHSHWGSRVAELQNEILLLREQNIRNFSAA